MTNVSFKSRLMSLFMAFVLLVYPVFLFGGCSGASNPSPPESEPPAEAPASAPTVPQEEPEEPEEVSDVWTVDTEYINLMLSETRFTRAWEHLTVDDYPVSSPEAKQVFLAAVLWETDEGLQFNPLAAIAITKAWFLGLLEEYEIASYGDLIEEDGEVTIANQIGQEMTSKFIEAIMSDEYFVWLVEAPEHWYNTGSVADGILVSSSFAGISGNRTAWVVRTAEQMEKAATEGLDPVTDEEVLALEPDCAGAQLTRCANPTYPTKPPVPEGPTDEPPPEESPPPEEPPLELEPKDPILDPVNQGNAPVGGGQNDDPGPGEPEPRPEDPPEVYEPPAPPEPVAPTPEPTVPEQPPALPPEDPEGDGTQPGGDPEPDEGESSTDNTDSGGYDTPPENQGGGGTVTDDEGFI